MMNLRKRLMLGVLYGVLLAGILAGCEKAKKEAAKEGALKVVEVQKVDIPAPRPIDDPAIFGMARLRDPNQLIERLGTWISLVQPTMNAEALRGQMSAQGIDLKALRPGENVALFLLAPTANSLRPTGAALLPVTSDSPLVQSLKAQRQDLQTTAVAQYTLVGPEATGLRQAAQRGQTLINLDQSPAPTDIQLHLNLESVMAKYGQVLNSQIQMFQSIMAISMANQPGGATRAARLQPILMAEVQMLLDCLNQAQSLNLGADMGLERLELSMIARGKPGTTLEKILKAGPVSAPELTAHLDPGALIRAQFSLRDPKGMADLYMKFFEKALGANQQAAMAQFKTELEELSKLGKLHYGISFSLLPKGGFTEEVIAVADNNDAFVEIVRKKMLNWLNAGPIHDFYKGMGIEIKITEDPKPRTVAGAEVYRFTINAKATSDLTPEEKAKLEKMFSAMTFEMAKIGKYVALTLGEPIDALAARLTGGQPGSPIQATKIYPPGGLFYMDFSIPAAIDFAKANMPEEKAGSLPQFAPNAPPLMAAGYHTEGLAYYRLGLPKGLIAALSPTPAPARTPNAAATPQ